jgi:hypothetical protein
VKKNFALAGVIFSACSALVLSACATAPVVAQTSLVNADTHLPRVFALRPEELVLAKRFPGGVTGRLGLARRELLNHADAELKAPIVAVTDKHTLMPPSGDKHDYFSLSPYWWPDPSKPDGLPYIRRDGVTNPESKKDLDQPRIAAMGYNVNTLALAWYLIGDEKYATRASAQLHAWFLDSATKMNPHLRFSQLVKGNPEERGSGIVDTRWFIEAVDAAGLLAGSKSWTAEDDADLKTWFRAYLDWLLTSPNGKHEHDAKNNHGSWYAAQTATYALFVGDSARARQIAEGSKARIGWQITADGDQPIENQRTRSMHYSAFNAEALSRLAEGSRRVGVDLWHYQSPSGGSLQRAIRKLARYTNSNEKWPGQQIDSVSLDLLMIHFRRDLAILGDKEMILVLKRLPQSELARDRSALLYPSSLQ